MFHLPGASDLSNVRADPLVRCKLRVAHTTKELVIMSSYFRHILRITPIGLLTSALVWIGATATANAAQQGADHFMVTVYSNSRGSQELLIGHYDAALAQIE